MATASRLTSTRWVIPMSEPAAGDDGETDRPETVEYGITVAETAPHISWRQTYLYWTPEPSSPQEALEVAAREYDEVISSAGDVQSRTVPAPEGWSA